MGDDPAYLPVGTAVSAKYKGAFCEARVSKVVRVVKCKVTWRGGGGGSSTLPDEQVRGPLRAGHAVQARHPDKKEYLEATVSKVQDCSQYTVVFDDGDITTLRRTALCLKSGRHFNESETLDQLPLTHPEHWGFPVGRGRGRRAAGREGRDERGSDQGAGDLAGPSDGGAAASDGRAGNSSPDRDRHDDSAELLASLYTSDIGKVVCVEAGDGKKRTWFPGLVVVPSAQPTVRINVREEYLVRSFRDGRYYTVPRKEILEFTREPTNDGSTGGAAGAAHAEAMSRALRYLDRDELPAHWERGPLFDLHARSDSDSDAHAADSSDDDPREEKDYFVARLYKFMDDRGTPLNKNPAIANKDIDMYRLFKVVHKLGGYNRVTNQNKWRSVAIRLGYAHNHATYNSVKQAYKKYLLDFEDLQKKLGCTMINHPRNAKKNRGRSLIRDKDRATPQSPRPPDVPSRAETPSVVAEQPAAADSSDDVDTPRKKGKARVQTPPPPPPQQTRSKSAASGRVTPAPAQRRGRKRRERSPGATTSAQGAPPPVIAPAPAPAPPPVVPSETVASAAVGDKLKVYYGPTHESKVTYEAKVLEVDSTSGAYLVHYTGWNTRYDEWIKPQRIAENLSQQRGAARRAAAVAARRGGSRSPAPPPGAGRRGRRPATAQLAQSSPRTQRRTRRTSAVSSLATTTDSEQEEDEEENDGGPDVEPELEREPEREDTGDDEEEDSEPVRTRRSAATRGRPPSAVVPPAQSPPGATDDGPRSVRTPRGKRQPRRAAAASSLAASSLAASLAAAGTDSDDEGGETRGRDFDLNQIRSELKGFEKAIKPPAEPDQDQPAPPPPAAQDDVYEFKEPEPFEFEGRKPPPPATDQGGAEQADSRQQRQKRQRVYVESPPASRPRPPHNTYRRASPAKRAPPVVAPPPAPAQPPLPTPADDTFDRLVESALEPDASEDELPLFRELPPPGPGVTAGSAAPPTDDPGSDSAGSDVMSEPPPFTRNEQLSPPTLDPIFRGLKAQPDDKASDDDDPIGAAIQRAMTHTMTDEDSSGDELFTRGGRSVAPPPAAAPKIISPALQESDPSLLDAISQQTAQLLQEPAPAAPPPPPPPAKPATKIADSILHKFNMIKQHEERLVEEPIASKEVEAVPEKVEAKSPPPSPKRVKVEEVLKEEVLIKEEVVLHEEEAADEDEEEDTPLAQRSRDHVEVKVEVKREHVEDVEVKEEVVPRVDEEQEAEDEDDEEDEDEDAPLAKRARLALEAARRVVPPPRAGRSARRAALSREYVDSDTDTSSGSEASAGEAARDVDEEVVEEEAAAEADTAASSDSEPGRLVIEAAADEEDEDSEEVPGDSEDEEGGTEEPAPDMSLLLCKETIPGSPAAPEAPVTQQPTAAAPPRAATPPPPAASATEPRPRPRVAKSLMLEMPFASAPPPPTAPVQPAPPPPAPAQSPPPPPAQQHDTASATVGRKRRRSQRSDEQPPPAVAPPPPAAAAPAKRGRRPLAHRQRVSSESRADCDALGSPPHVAQAAPQAAPPQVTAPPPSTARHPRYDFLGALAPELDAAGRIAALTQRLADLRSVYNDVKAELAAVDRRRKKLRRRTADQHSRPAAATAS